MADAEKYKMCLVDNQWVVMDVDTSKAVGTLNEVTDAFIADTNKLVILSNYDLVMIRDKLIALKGDATWGKWHEVNVTEALRNINKLKESYEFGIVYQNQLQNEVLECTLIYSTSDMHGTICTALAVNHDD